MKLTKNGETIELTEKEAIAVFKKNGWKEVKPKKEVK